MSEAGNPQAANAVLEILQAASAHHKAGRLREAEELYRQLLGRNPDLADALHGVGLIALHANKPLLAVAYLARASQLAPHVGVYMYNQGEAWMATGDIQQGAACFRLTVALDPMRPEPHAAYGIALGQMQQFEQAAASLQKAIELGMDRPHVTQNYANALLQLGRFSEAEAQARKAIARAPNLAEAWHTLGEALGNQKRNEEAIDAFRKAVTIKPDLALSHYSLGLTLGRVGKVDEAIESLRAALRVQNNFPEALINLGTMLIGQRKLEEAIESLRTAVRLRPTYLDARIELARALEVAQRRQEAADEFKEIQKLSPDNPNIQYHIAALSGQGAPPAAPPSLVTALFDRHAPTFDQHLTRDLQYRAPQLLKESVLKAGAVQQLDVLDLGCGTGLCGVEFRPMARRLVGVDLSAAMIEKARERNVYDELKVGEAIASLQESPDSYDLIVAGDVLCYFGDLSGVVSAAAGALRPGGLFAFSVEAGEHEGWVLRHTRRYAHSERYLRDTAQQSGLTVLRCEEQILRTEGGKEMPGWVVALQKK